jgi:hypothetical protein
MATLAGFYMPLSEAAFDDLVDAVLTTLPAVLTEGRADDPPPMVFGSLTDTQPVTEVVHILAGMYMASFDMDYYNTIHLIPNPLDLGNVVDTETANVFVWNAYFTAQLLASITPVDDYGLSLYEPDPAPSTFLPLEYRTYQVTAGREGPDRIDAAYIFSFPSDQITLEVIGVRTIAFAFPPNWGEGSDNAVVEWYDWLTDVITSYDGTKQRRGLRGDPRRGFEYDAAVTGDDKRLFDNVLNSGQSKPYAVPLWFDRSSLALAAAIDDITIYLDTTEDRDFKVGQRAMIWVSPLVNESFIVASIGASTLIAQSPLMQAWPAGARIYPVRYAYLEQSQRLSHLTAATQTFRVQFQLEFGEPGTATESGITYRSEPVYLNKPNWLHEITDDYRRKLETLDYLTGGRFLEDESNLPEVITSANWALISRSERRAFIEWLYARAGKYNGVWVPTHNADLIIAAPIGSADSTIDVKFTGYSLYIKQKLGRRDIVIWTRSGSYYFCRITASTNLGGGVERLSITPGTGVNLAVADILKISFMMYIHLASDRVEINHLTNTVAQCQLQLESSADDV